MNETSRRWRPIAPSEFPWEREALAFVRQGLPDQEPHAAWANFEFVAEDGSIHEVDLLVLTPKGVFLVEIKSWPGALEGDANTWTLRRDGSVFTYDSPLLLANRKARKLGSLLRRQKAARTAQIPLVEPLVFLSHPNLQCKLSGTAHQGVHTRAGILKALTEFDPATPAQPGRIRVYRNVAQAVERAMDEAGIRPSQKSKRVGDYLVEEVLFAGPLYQDWLARHASLEKVRRRVRIYSQASAAGPEARARLERAARRELEALEPLSHPGLLKPLQLTHHELGPALVFEHDPKALRLDHFLAQAGQRLGFEARLGLVRQIAEILQYVHEKRVFHRALSPQSVLVSDPDSETPRLRILDWQTAAYDGLTTRTSHGGLSGTSHLDQLVEDAVLVYAAPEALTVAEASPEELDVFSLGALAYLILSGKPPAGSAFELHDRLREGKGLQLSAALDGAHPRLVEVVQLATHPVVTSRISSILEFLEYLEMAEEELRKPEEEPVTDPLSAQMHDLLPGGFRVKKRLGKGSTSVVFLVERDGHEQVLKLALDEKAGERLQAEARELQRLDHPRIVQLLDTVAVGDRFGLLLSRAGDESVAQRLRKEGRLELELLQRFGEDLLQAVDYLERVGVSHRDIKPDNLGVAKVGRNDELHAILFDFSLAGIEPTNITAGTRPYLDPFLSERRPRRWDLQAERFAAAVTLHEMATGALPRWGDGQSNPAVLDPGEEVRIEAELFDTAVRAPLTAFFQQALRRDPRQRFDNAEEMLAAWRQAFERAGQPATVTTYTEERPDELARACALAGLDTSVSLLHLSTRAVNVLERAQVVQVKDLLQIPTLRLSHIRGVGKETRKELLEAVRLLTERLGRPIPVPEETPQPAGEAEGEPAVSSIDLLVPKLLPAARSATGERRVLEALFGLSEEAPLHPSLWPSQTDVAEGLGLTRARVSQILGKVRQRWADRTRVLTPVRDIIAELLAMHAGVMTAEELFAALLATRGSALEEPLRTRYAAAVLRAATEAEESRKSPRWMIRRRGERVLFALTEPQGEPLLDYAEALGHKADDLARLDPLASPQRALEVLQSVPRPLPGLPLTIERLLRLATAASHGAALSSRLEIYPPGLAPDRALRLASGSLLGGSELTVEEVRQRVASRYPKAAPLPGRPELDRLLFEALGLSWDPAAGKGRGAYVFPSLQGLTLTSSTTFQRPRTLAPAEEVPAERVEVQLFEDRLRRAESEGAFLVLLVDPRSLLRAEEALTRRFAVDRVSLEERWIAAMRRLARENDVDWSLVLRSDAEDPERPDAQQLRRFVSRALEDVEAALASSPRTLLLTRAGLLSRYGHMSLLERLRERVTRRPAPGEIGLHGLWLLIPSEGSTTGPRIDGASVPVLTRSQWAHVPTAWLDLASLKESA